MGVFAGESFSSMSCEYVPLIHFFVLNFEQKDYYYINLKCRNKHSFNILLEKFKIYVDNLKEKINKNKQKDNENYNMDDFMYNTIKEDKIYDDTKCEKHKKNIEKICKKCQLNLCNECQHDCNEIINIKDYLLEENEKNELKNILNFLDKIFSQSDSNINDINKDLFFLVSLIINRYLNDKFSYEIIQNCKNCLDFNYKKELIEIMNSENDIYEKSIKIINLYNNPFKLLLNPSYIINLSNLKNIKNYKIKVFENKKYYYYLIDLNEKKFALYNFEYFDVFNKDSLELIFSYKYEKIKEEENDDNDFILLYLKNGNLMMFKNNLIIIYQILDNTLKKINEKNLDKKIINAIELENKKIIATTNNDILLYNFIDNNLELELKINFFNSEEEVYLDNLIDLKDSQNLLIMHGNIKGYFNYIKKVFIKKEENNDNNNSNCILFNNNILIELEGFIHIRDIKTFNIINSHEMDTPGHKIYKLNDGSFLCGLYSKHELYLQQYVYEYDNVIDLEIIEFPNNRGHFGFIHQFENGNIMLSANGTIYILN